MRWSVFRAVPPFLPVHSHQPASSLLNCAVGSKTFLPNQIFQQWIQFKLLICWWSRPNSWLRGLCQVRVISTLNPFNGEWYLASSYLQVFSGLLSGMVGSIPTATAWLHPVCRRVDLCWKATQLSPPASRCSTPHRCAWGADRAQGIALCSCRLEGFMEINSFLTFKHRCYYRLMLFLFLKK